MEMVRLLIYWEVALSPSTTAHSFAGYIYIYIFQVNHHDHTELVMPYSKLFWLSNFSSDVTLMGFSL